MSKHKKKIYIDINLDKKEREKEKEKEKGRLFIYIPNNYNRNILTFSSNDKIYNNYFIGNNFTSETFNNASILMLYNCTTFRLGLSIKTVQFPIIYSARLYINNQPSLLLTSILDGSKTINSLAIGHIEIKALDLISIRMEFDNNYVIENGVNLALSYYIHDE
jgi:hypothetical protein